MRDMIQKNHLTRWGREKKGQHFVNSTFKDIFLDKLLYLIKISLTFIPKCPIDN